jgi:NADPH-dependent 2,4-dienoyl-CoA reductase/sulfur reductase-like enzyme
MEVFNFCGILPKITFKIIKVMLRILPLFFFLSYCMTAGLVAQSPQILKTEILIAGGGASGTAAALQAARMGRKVILVEETPWLGHLGGIPQQIGTTLRRPQSLGHGLGK